MSSKHVRTKIIESKGMLNRKYVSLNRTLRGVEEFTLNRDGLIISCNLEAVNVTGYEEEEIIGKHISIFYQPEEIDRATTDLERASRIGQVMSTGLRIKKRGVPFWAKMEIRFDSTTKSNPFFVVILQDITHKILSRERVHVIREEYLALFNNPFVGVFRFRISDYSIQLCNNKALEILGKNDSVNLKINGFFASEKQFDLFIGSLIAEKKVEGFEFLLSNEKEQRGNWTVISVQYFEKSGFAEGIMFDISDQHSQMLELQQVNADLDNFVYHASHDLRSPLTSIMGLVNLGIKEPSKEIAITYFELIRGRIDHLDTLLKDLIAVSYNNGAKEASELFDYEHEARVIIEELRGPHKSIVVIIEVIQRNDFITDPIRMQTILRHLLLNAFKYYNPVEPVPFVNLNIQVFPTHCKIYLKDNGIGIHPQFKERVYDMFFKATEQSGGSGLGLYIVKSMVDKLKGSISFESTPNVGTTFVVTIPNQIQQMVL